MQGRELWFGFALGQLDGGRFLAQVLRFDLVERFAEKLGDAVARVLDVLLARALVVLEAEATSVFDSEAVVLHTR